MTSLSQLSGRALRVLILSALFALLVPACLAVDPPGALHHDSPAANGGSDAEQAGSAGTSGAAVSAGAAGRMMTVGDAGSADDAGANNGGAGPAGGAGGAGPAGGAGGAGVAGAAPVDPCVGVVCNQPKASDCTSATEFTSFDAVGTCADGQCSYHANTVACTCQAHACTTDPCAKVTCNSPQGSSCPDTHTLRSYASTGTCTAGSCTYAPTDTTCAFGCSNAACNPDPCGSVTCNKQQPAQCTGSTLTTYAAIGTCSAGQCTYKPTTTTCAFGCASGACKPDPCVGMPCATPPASKCLSTSSFQSFDSTGSCTAGTCAYASHTISCNCAANACTTDPCANAPPCVTPPAATCKDANTKRTFASTGTCSAGSCNYATTDTACSFGCASGACKADPCATKTCASPSPAYCKDTSTLTTYASTGTCSGGNCTYNSTDKNCPFGCANAACKSDPCIGVTCSKANTCSGSTLTTFTSGTCSGGNCSFKSATSTCQFGCGTNGACKPDPCAGVTCKNSGTCSGGACTCTNRFNGTHCEYQVFRGIGVLAGDGGSDASAISRDGTIIVGESYPNNGANKPAHAVRSINGGALQLMAEISNLDQEAGCDTAAVDAADNVIGTCEQTPFICSASSTQAQAFITMPAGVTVMRVAAISTSSKAVVGYYEDADGSLAFRWTSSSGISLIPQASYPAAINGDGTIAVGEGWRWNATTNQTASLKNPTGGSIFANGVSTDGKVIIGTIDGNCMKWSGASFGTLTQLGQSSCLATNGDGSVVVGTEGNVAAYWDSSGTLHDMTDVANSPDLQGWSLSQAVSVSDDGKFIVGSGTNGNLQRAEGWVIHLP